MKRLRYLFLTMFLCVFSVAGHVKATGPEYEKVKVSAIMQGGAVVFSAGVQYEPFTVTDIDITTEPTSIRDIHGPNTLAERAEGLNIGFLIRNDCRNSRFNVRYSESRRLPLLCFLMNRSTRYIADGSVRTSRYGKRSRGIADIDRG